MSSSSRARSAPSCNVVSWLLGVLLFFLRTNSPPALPKMYLYVYLASIIHVYITSTLR